MARTGASWEVRWPQTGWAGMPPSPRAGMERPAAHIPAVVMVSGPLGAVGTVPNSQLMHQLLGHSPSPSEAPLTSSSFGFCFPTCNQPGVPHTVTLTSWPSGFQLMFFLEVTTRLRCSLSNMTKTISRSDFSGSRGPCRPKRGENPKAYLVPAHKRPPSSQGRHVPPVSTSPGRPVYDTRSLEGSGTP